MSLRFAFGPSRRFELLRNYSQYLGGRMRAADALRCEEGDGEGGDNTLGGVLRRESGCCGQWRACRYAPPLALSNTAFRGDFGAVDVD